MNEFVSIITVNYNGMEYLKNFLEAVCCLDYPKSMYEVIVVDNGSTDKSVEFIAKDYPDIVVIKNSKNLGFGGGNNVGIKKAKGDLIFLINNDTVPEKNFLKEAVECFQNQSRLKGQKVGAVGAKLLLIDKYLALKVKNAFLVSYEVSSSGKPFNSEFFDLPKETTADYYEQVYVPFNYQTKGPLKIKLTFRKYRTREFVFEVNNKIHTGVFHSRKNLASMVLSLDSQEIKKGGKDLIQNAGNFYFRDGYGRDRGAKIYKQKQYYEVDNNQYGKVETTQGFCGAGVLLNKKALQEVGYFDENFFMYYEDGDLSFRLQKIKWKIYYCPKSVIRHIHSASSKEWSPFFNYNVERGRLLLLIKHWPRIVLIREWVKYIFRDSIAVPLYFVLHNKKEEGILKFMTRLKVNISVVWPCLMNFFRPGKYSLKEIKKFY